MCLPTSSLQYRSISNHEHVFTQLASERPRFLRCIPYSFILHFFTTFPSHQLCPSQDLRTQVERIRSHDSGVSRIQPVEFPLFPKFGSVRNILHGPVLDFEQSSVVFSPARASQWRGWGHHGRRSVCGSTLLWSIGDEMLELVKWNEMYSLREVN